MDFNYSIKTHTNYTEILLSGNLLDSESGDALKNEIEQIIHENKLYFIFNLAEMNYLNSSGLNVLISLLTKIRNHGGELAVYQVPKKIKQVFLITKLNSIFNVVDTIGEAEKQIIKAMTSNHITQK
jgi:anti-sigma B factor antagonist